MGRYGAFTTMQRGSLYVREAVLGRDARSVFPTEITKQAAADRASAPDLLGGRNFIAVSEVGLLHPKQQDPSHELQLCARQTRT